VKLKFYFNTPVWADQVSIYLIGEDASGKRFIAKPMELSFGPIDEGLQSDPTLKISGFISREFLPALANALAESGYRHESTDAGELKATKAHLDDMRKLVLKVSDNKPTEDKC
jgi:hypothetical protein